MKRPGRDETYIAISDIIAKRGTCDRLQVGAVLTIDNRIIATGYNGPLSNEPKCSDSVCDKSKSCVRAVHAEMNAILFAAKQGISTDGATLYCTYSPCPTCAKVIVQAGVVRVVFRSLFRDNEGLIILTNNQIDWKHYTR